MKSYNKIFRQILGKNIIMVAVFVIILFILGVPKITTIQTADAQNLDIEEKLEDTRTTIEQITIIKDSNISDSEKEIAEINLKKKVLTNILELGQLQVSYLKERLDESSLPDTDDWVKIKGLFYSLVDEYSSYYKDTENKIKDEDNITIKYIKDTAQRIESKKSNVIDIGTQEINDVLVTFEISNILSLADNRLEKVKLDVTKIYTKNLTHNEDIKDMFFDSSKALEKAHEINNSAKEIVLNIYSIKIAANTASNTTSTSTATTTIKTSDDEKDGLIDTITKQLELEWSVLHSTTTSTSTEEESMPEPRVLIDNYIRSLIISSLDNVKKAYSIFIDMSINANELLN